MNTYTEGEPVGVPGHMVGRPVQCYDRNGRIFAGIVMTARYEEENLLADVAVINDQSGPGTISVFASWSIQRNLRMVSPGDPQPNTFAIL